MNHCTLKIQKDSIYKFWLMSIFDFSPRDWGPWFQVCRLLLCCRAQASRTPYCNTLQHTALCCNTLQPILLISQSHSFKWSWFLCLSISLLLRCLLSFFISVHAHCYLWSARPNWYPGTACPIGTASLWYCSPVSHSFFLCLFFSCILCLSLSISFALALTISLSRVHSLFSLYLSSKPYHSHAHVHTTLPSPPSYLLQWAAVPFHVSLSHTHSNISHLGTTQTCVMSYLWNSHLQAQETNIHIRIHTNWTQHSMMEREVWQECIADNIGLGA